MGSPLRRKSSRIDLAAARPPPSRGSSSAASYDRGSPGRGGRGSVGPTALSCDRAIELRQDLRDPLAIPELAQGFLPLAVAIESLVGQHREEGPGQLGARWVDEAATAKRASSAAARTKSSRVLGTVTGESGRSGPPPARRRSPDDRGDFKAFPSSGTIAVASGRISFRTSMGSS